MNSLSKANNVVWKCKMAYKSGLVYRCGKLHLVRSVELLMSWTKSFVTEIVDDQMNRLKCYEEIVSNERVVNFLLKNAISKGFVWNSACCMKTVNLHFVRLWYMSCFFVYFYVAIKLFDDIIQFLLKIQCLIFDYV